MNLRYKFLRLLGYKTYDEMFKELHSGKRKQISHNDGQKAVEKYSTQRAGICEGWEIDFRPPGYLKLNL